MTILLSDDDVRRVLEPRACIDALEVAFGDLSAGEAVNRPRSHTYTPLGEGHRCLFKSTILRADVIVVRSREAATFHHPPGNAPVEVAEVKRLADGPAAKMVELGDVVRGRAGRRTREDVTLFTGGGLGVSSGLGIQFAAVAHVVYQAARSRGLGRELPTEWLTEVEKP